MADVTFRLEEARELLAGRSAAVVLTGAGVSADSGMPTFRGEDGLWKEHRPEELASPRGFRRDPRLVWEWYAWRREKARGCDPNAGHLALARWALRDPAVRLATQNVDELHREALERARGEAGARTCTGRDEAGAQGDDPAPGDAGADTPSPAGERHLELHGSLFRVRCTECEHRGEHRDPVDTDDRESLPRCPACGALLRPDVVWFGESLDPDVLEATFGAAREADVCLSVGTSAAVEPAASIARAAVRSGADLVEINPDDTALTPLASVALRGRAARVLPALLDEEG